MASTRPQELKLIAILLLLSILAVSAWYIASYYVQLPSSPMNVQTSGLAMVDVLFNYGNRTSSWNNRTGVPSGTSLYDVTDLVAQGKVEATYHSVLNQHLLTGIHSVRNDESRALYWTLWVYCRNDNAWMRSAWGADMVKVGRDTLFVAQSTGNLVLTSNAFAWYYQNVSGDWLPPVYGASQVSICRP